MSSTPVRRSARIKGEIAQLNGLDDKTIKRIRREAISARREIHRLQMEKERVEMEEEQADYDSKLDVWKESMRKYYEQRRSELEQKKEDAMRIRNPMAFYADQWGIEFLDKGGVAEQYRTECLFVGKSYYRVIVDTFIEEHPTKPCEDVQPSDIQFVQSGVFRFHFQDLPPDALSLPWMKPWKEDNQYHSKCGGKMHYTIREMTRFTHTDCHEAQTQW